MQIWAQVLITMVTAVAAVAASSGFWAWMQRKSAVRSETDKLLLGLAYKEIISMGFSYIERGWITQDEYEDYRRYLYDPYKKLGGNGVTERVMAAVSNLPLRSRAMYAQIIKEAETRRPEHEYAVNGDYDADVYVK